MGVEKRIARSGKTSFRVRLRRTGGGEISKTFERLADAKLFMAEATVRLTAGAWGLHGEAKHRTVADAIDRYLEVLPTLRLKDERNPRRHALWWRQELGFVKLAELTPPRIADVRDRMLAGKGARMQTRGGRPRGPATTVRYLAALSTIMSLAAEDWGWLEQNPVRRVKKPTEPQGRVRYLNEAERIGLLNACRESASRLLYTVVLVGLSTGMRKGEILSLRWRQVSFNPCLIALEDTKNGAPRHVPLEGPAAELLTTLASQPHTGSDFVFPGQISGKSLDISKAWSTAMARAGLQNFHFHDLRHTAGSYLAMRNASILEIGAILGHRSPNMTQRYAHLSTEHSRGVLGGMLNAIFPPEEGQRRLSE